MSPPLDFTAQIARPFDLRTALGAAVPLALLRVAPGCWVCGAGPFERRSRAPDRGVAFYVNDFSLRASEPWLIPAESWEEIEISTPSSEPIAMAWKNLSRGPFEDCYEEIMAGLHAGSLRKAVLAVAERGRVVEGAVIEIMARTFEAPVAIHGWPYAFIEGASGFAGVSPECLFSLRGRRLQTMALAGTAKPTERADFEQDDKEIREHEFVVETLRSKLASFGDARQGPREILNVGDLLHFITRFEIETAEVDIESILRLLHPTPAIGVLPWNEDTSARLESWRQRLGTPVHFGAPFGVMWRGGFHAVVAIRGVSWSGGEVFLPAGCGIIEGSQLEREWRELALKREWVKRALRLA